MVFVADPRDVTYEIKSTSDSLSVGASVCRYCGRNVGGYPCHCPGVNEAYKGRAVAAATKTLESYGYTVTPPPEPRP